MTVYNTAEFQPQRKFQSEIHPLKKNLRHEQWSGEISFSLKARWLKASFIRRRSALPGEEPWHLAVHNGIGAGGPVLHQRGGGGGGEDGLHHRAAVGLDGDLLLCQPLKHTLHILK